MAPGGGGPRPPLAARGDGRRVAECGKYDEEGGEKAQGFSLGIGGLADTAERSTPEPTGTGAGYFPIRVISA
jgi:hypothetical protein